MRQSLDFKLEYRKADDVNSDMREKEKKQQIQVEHFIFFGSDMKYVKYD